MNSEGRFTSEWKTCEVPGYFSLDVPEHSTVTVENDNSLLVCTLRLTHPTEVRSGLYPMKDGRLMNENYLRSEIERYMRDCAHCSNVNIESPVDVDAPDVIAFQAVALKGTDDWWIARIYGRHGGQQLLLVDWHGPQTQLKKVVFPMLISIQFRCDN